MGLFQESFKAIKALGEFTNKKVCKACNGRKKINGVTCPKCNGMGVIIK